MAQLQLPIFRAGMTKINSRIAVQKEAGSVCYIHGHLPVFQHEEQDVRSFRMFTSQMIVSRTVKPKEIGDIVQRKQVDSASTPVVCEPGR
jgi:hypothetical protein